MTSAPPVSVVMAVRDGERYLDEAIGSLRTQTFGDFELIVVDDASTDGSRAILSACDDPRLVVLENERHLGLTPSLNRGLARARGELVARQDADDRSRPERLARQVTAMRARPDLALLGSRGYLVDEQGRGAGVLDRPVDPYGIRWYHMFDNAFAHGAVMFRRSVVDELGGYDESFAWSQDWELWGRVLRRHAAANLPDRLVDYRTHAASVTATPRDPARHGESVRRIVAANVETTVGVRLSPAEIDLMSGFLLGLDRGDLGPYLALVDRLVVAFQRCHPQAAANGEPVRTLGVQLDALAARARPARRATVVGVYAAALRRRPALAGRLPLTRAVARLLFGPRGIVWLRRLGFGRPVPAAERARPQ